MTKPGILIAAVFLLLLVWVNAISLGNLKGLLLVNQQYKQSVHTESRLTTKDEIGRINQGRELDGPATSKLSSITEQSDIFSRSGNEHGQSRRLGTLSLRLCWSEHDDRCSLFT